MSKILIKYIKSYLATFQGLSGDCYFGLALCMLESILVGVFYYLSIYLVDTLHFDITTSGLIISCYGIGAVFGGIIGGKLSDRLSSSAVSTYSLLAQAVGYLIFSLVATPTLLMLNALLLGVASYSFITANHLFVLESCHADESQSLKALSILAMAANLGLGLSAVILGSILSIGFRNVFLMTSALIVLLAIIASRYNTSKSSDNITRGREDAQENSVNTAIQPDVNVLIFTLACVLFVGMIVTQNSATYAVYIKSVFPSFGIQAVTILFALNSFIVVMASTIVCDYIKNYNKLIMVGLGGFLIGFGMTILSFSHLFTFAILSCIVNTIGEIIFFAVAQLLCYQSGGENTKGTSLGLFRVAYASSRVLGPVTGSWIYERSGGDMLWVVCGIIGTIFLLASIFLSIWNASKTVHADGKLQSIYS